MIWSRSRWTRPRSTRSWPICASTPGMPSPDRARSPSRREPPPFDEAYCADHAGVCSRGVCAAGGERRWLRHGRGDALDICSNPFSPPRKWAKAPALGWPRSTASSSRTTASSMSTASRARERPSRSTCPGTRPRLAGRRRRMTAAGGRTRSRNHSAGGRRADDPGNDHDDARATRVHGAGRRHPGRGHPSGTGACRRDPPAHDRRGHARDERPGSGQEPVVALSEPQTPVHVRLHRRRHRPSRRAGRRGSLYPETLFSAGSGCQGSGGAGRAEIGDSRIIILIQIRTIRGQRFMMNPIF